MQLPQFQIPKHDIIVPVLPAPKASPDTTRGAAALL